jgi:hypothetical protein
MPPTTATSGVPSPSSCTFIGVPRQPGYFISSVSGRRAAGHETLPTVYSNSSAYS